MKVDWKQPLEYACKPGIPVNYVGQMTQRDGKPITDEYKFLVLIGEEMKGHYVDEFGNKLIKSKAGNLVPQQWVRNPLPQEEAAAPGVHDQAALVELAAAVEETKAIAHELRKTTHQSIGAMATQQGLAAAESKTLADMVFKLDRRVDDLATKIGGLDGRIAAALSSLQAAAESLRGTRIIGDAELDKLAKRQADDYVTAQAILVDEMRKVIAEEIAKVRPSVPAPAPAVTPAPDDDAAHFQAAAEHELAVNGKTVERLRQPLVALNLDKVDHDLLSRLDARELRKSMHQLMAHPLVTKVVLSGEVQRCPRGKQSIGVIKYHHDTPFGFDAKIVDFDKVRPLHVFVNPPHRRGEVASFIESINQEALRA